MKLTRKAHPSARLELINSARFYEQKQSGLGYTFLSAADKTVEQILDWPYIAPVFPRWTSTPTVRCASVAGFPFQLVYYVRGTELMIVAYAHNRRRPGYWKSRIDWPSK